DEFGADTKTARLLGWHLNEVVSFVGYSIEHASGSGPLPTVPPDAQVRARLVGIVVFNTQAVVHDDVDHFLSYVLFPPALTRSLVARRIFWPYPTYALRLDRGRRDVDTVERELIGLLPPGTTYNFYEPSVVEAQVER